MKLFSLQREKDNCKATMQGTARQQGWAALVARGQEAQEGGGHLLEQGSPARGWGLQPPHQPALAVQPSEVMPNELPKECSSISAPEIGNCSQPGDLATGFGPDFQSEPLERGKERGMAATPQNSPFPPAASSWGQ